MRLEDFGLLSDENVASEVVVYLRSGGFDVLDVKEQGLLGVSDTELIRRAFAENRVLLTHDRDFGKLVVANLEPMVGIVYLRPGHIQPQFSVAALAALLELQLDISPPFLIVAERIVRELRIRYRQL